MHGLGLRRIIPVLGGKIPTLRFDPDSATFTAGMAKRAGPGPFAAAPIVQIKGKHRWHLIIKAISARAAADLLRGSDDLLAGGTGVQVAVDVDPMGML